MSQIRDADWEDVRVFTALARHRTVRRASQALGVHYSTVSRRLEGLEATLGAKLFERHPEGLVLTEAGEELSRVCDPFAERLFEVQRKIAGRDTELSGKVTLTLAEPLAEYAFAPRLPEFFARHPRLELAFAVTLDFLDLSRREADVAIRMDNNPPDTLVGRRFFAYTQSIYASRDYVSEVNPAQNPGDARWLGWGTDTTPFPAWTQGTEFAKVPVWGSFANLRLQVAAVEAGLGIAMLPCFVADREAELVRITERPPEPSRDIWLLTHSDLHRTARVRAVLDFATEVLNENRAAILGERY